MKVIDSSMPLSRTSSADMAATIIDEVRRLLGATTPSVRAIRRRYSRLLAGESPDWVLEVVRLVLADKSWSARLIAFELLAEHHAVMSQLNGLVVEEMADGLSDWGSVDLFGVTVAGVAWREGQVSDRQVMRWARSKDHWHRRLALVATVPLNSKARGGDGDAVRTLELCRALVDDRDDMVVKALSWALRELSKRDPKEVARFLRKEDTRLASRIRREVWSKLKTGRKVPQKAD